MFIIQCGSTVYYNIMSVTYTYLYGTDTISLWANLYSYNMIIVNFKTSLMFLSYRGPWKMSVFRFNA